MLSTQQISQLPTPIDNFYLKLHVYSDTNKVSVKKPKPSLFPQNLWEFK